MRIKILDRKLGREKAHGQSWHGLNIIEIDPRQPEREKIDTLVHEILHLAKPEYEEEEVIRISNIISSNLWKYGYRRIAR
jgi:hypothetical protein